MRFQVPQFIEIEDKIFGPLSFRQFVYVIGGAGLCYLFFQIMPGMIAIIFALPVGGLALALAFYQINNKPFIHTLEAAFKYAMKSKFYLWKKSEGEAAQGRAALKERAEAESVYNPIAVPRLSESRLKDISWGLEVKEDLLSNED